MSTGFLRSSTSQGHLLVLVRLKDTVRGFFSLEMTSEGISIYNIFLLGSTLDTRSPIRVLIAGGSFARVFLVCSGSC